MLSIIQDGSAEFQKQKTTNNAAFFNIHVEPHSRRVQVKLQVLVLTALDLTIQQ